MDVSLLKKLVDPASHEPVQLIEPISADESDIEDGVLKGSNERQFPIRRGIPRFVETDDRGQQQTSSSFAFKWQQKSTYEAPHILRTHQKWLCERYGFTSPQHMTEYFASRSLILDAGCGGGLSTSTWLNQQWADSSSSEWVALDFSEAFDVAWDTPGDLPENPFCTGRCTTYSICR